jgi:hypothetical protein
MNADSRTPGSSGIARTESGDPAVAPYRASVTGARGDDAGSCVLVDHDLCGLSLPSVIGAALGTSAMEVHRKLGWFCIKHPATQTPNGTLSRAMLFHRNDIYGMSPTENRALNFYGSMLSGVFRRLTPFQFSVRFGADRRTRRRRVCATKLLSSLDEQLYRHVINSLAPRAQEFSTRDTVFWAHVSTPECHIVVEAPDKLGLIRLPAPIWVGHFWRGLRAWAEAPDSFRITAHFTFPNAHQRAALARAARAAVWVGPNCLSGAPRQVRELVDGAMSGDSPQQPA